MICHKQRRDVWCERRESNPDQRLRRPLHYPLCYARIGGGTRGGLHGQRRGNSSFSFSARGKWITETRKDGEIHHKGSKDTKIGKGGRGRKEDRDRRAEVELSLKRMAAARVGRGGMGGSGGMGWQPVFLAQFSTANERQNPRIKTTLPDIRTRSCLCRETMG